MTKSEFLISLAQNDYMIDQHMLPDGKELCAAAAYIEEMEAEIERLHQEIEDWEYDLKEAMERSFD